MHRIILAAHSRYFRKLCSNGFKEAFEQAASLDDDPLVAVEIMIDYFYTLDYTHSASHLRYAQSADGKACDSLAMLHAQVFLVADKYGIPGLARLAHTAFQQLIHAEANTLFLPPKPKPDDIDMKLAEVIKVVRYVFDHVPPVDNRLCTTTINAFMLHKLLTNDAFPKTATWYRVAHRLKRLHFDTLLAKVPSFADDLNAHYQVLTVGERILTLEKDPRVGIIRGVATYEAAFAGADYTWQFSLNQSRGRVRRWSHLEGLFARGLRDLHTERQAVDEGLTQDDPPEGLHLTLKVEESGSDSAGEEVKAMTEDNEYDALAEAEGSDDPPRDLYLMEEEDMEDWRSESVDEEVMRMMEHAEYDVEAEAEGNDDPPQDLYLVDDAMECELEEVAAEVMDVIHWL